MSLLSQIQQRDHTFSALRLAKDGMYPLDFRL
jgi:hypothetical protein